MYRHLNPAMLIYKRKLEIKRDSIMKKGIMAANQCCHKWIYEKNTSLYTWRICNWN